MELVKPRKRKPYNKLRKQARGKKRPKASHRSATGHNKLAPRGKAPLPSSLNAKRRNQKPIHSKRIIAPINTVWFKECLLKSGVTQRKIADALGLDPSQISILLSGRRRMQMHEAVIIADLINQPLDSVLMNAGAIGEPMATPELVTRGLLGHDESSIEVAGYIGDEMRVISDLNSIRGPRLVAGISGLGAENVKALRVQTGGTRFQGLDGALIYYRENASIDPSSIGKISIVKLSSGESFLRVLKRGYQAGRFDLTLLDGTITHQDVLIESASTVLWMKIG